MTAERTPATGLRRMRKDYSYAMVCGPSTNYLWVLARTPALPGETLTRLLTQAAEAGFPTGSVIRVKHGM